MSWETRVEQKSFSEVVDLFRNAGVEIGTVEVVEKIELGYFEPSIVLHCASLRHAATAEVMELREYVKYRVSQDDGCSYVVSLAILAPGELPPRMEMRNTTEEENVLAELDFEPEEGR